MGGGGGVMAQLPAFWLDVPGAGLGVQRHESLQPFK